MDVESEDQDDFKFIKIFATFNLALVYLKGLSLVPSSEGFTMTAFLPANLMFNNCVTQWDIAHSAKSIQGSTNWQKLTNKTK